MKELIIKMISYFTLFISGFLKQDDKIILVGAKQGHWYMDNSKYIYEWLLINRGDLQVVWSTKNKVILKKLKKLNKPVISPYSLKGIILIAKARVALYTNSVDDIAVNNYGLPKRVSLISLRHGRSVKRIRFARKNHKIDAYEKKQRIFEMNLINYAISTSEFVSDMQEECLLIGREKHIVTGYPRNDQLYNVDKIRESLWNDFIGENEYDFIVLYAPSWRHKRNPTSFFPFDDYSTKELVDFLKNNKILLLLRPHVNDLKYSETKEFLNSIVKASRNVKLCTHYEIEDVNQVLYYTDILMSDYSAIYHDFLLLDRPLIFLPYDFDDFEKNNGFLYNYYENLPGFCVLSFSNLLSALTDVIMGVDIYKEKRRLLATKIHKFKDDKSCLRVSKIIEEVRRK